MGDDTDTPNLMRILEQVRSRWNVDSKRMLLTGMSDGGTFCYVTGFDSASPLHASGAGVGDVPSADGRDRRRRPAARAADPYRARQARLDVSGAGGAADQPGAVGRRRRRHLPRARRSQPLLSARDQCGDFRPGSTAHEKPAALRTPPASSIFSAVDPRIQQVGEARPGAASRCGRGRSRRKRPRRRPGSDRRGRGTALAERRVDDLNDRIGHRASVGILGHDRGKRLHDSSPKPA